MATGTVVKGWKDAGRAYLAVRVKEADGSSVEYIAAVSLRDLAGKPLPEQKALLVEAVKAERDARLSGVAGPLAIAGSVVV